MRLKMQTQMLWLITVMSMGVNVDLADALSGTSLITPQPSSLWCVVGIANGTGQIITGGGMTAR